MGFCAIARNYKNQLASISAHLDGLNAIAINCSLVWNNVLWKYPCPSCAVEQYTSWRIRTCHFLYYSLAPFALLSLSLRDNDPPYYLQVIFGTFYAKSLLCGHVLGVPSMTGLSFLFKKSVVDQMGGLAQFANSVAEDTLICKAVHSLGYQIEFSSQPGWQNPPPAVSLRNHHARNARYNNYSCIEAPRPLQDNKELSLCTINVRLKDLL
jgi:hypothetical protein